MKVLFLKGTLDEPSEKLLNMFYLMSYFLWVISWMKEVQLPWMNIFISRNDLTGYSTLLD